MKQFLDKLASLTPREKKIICQKDTEFPHSGRYNVIAERGTYLCRRCGLALFRSANQFYSGCGWPSFDESILKTVRQIPDEDGLRMEISCQRCHSHLGHVFSGEYFTSKNLRHCVNSLALDFVEDSQVLDSEEAIVAGGCFWGVDYYLKKLPGVLKVEVGYCGGVIAEPTYEQVCQGDSGHYEVIRVIFDQAVLNYREVIKRFFEIHDPTQRGGQGPDWGPQYESAIFYFNESQRAGAEELIYLLMERDYKVVTKLLPMQPFWPAEEYHQDYYSKHGKMPYCHQPISRFA